MHYKKDNKKKTGKSMSGDNRDYIFLISASKWVHINTQHICASLKQGGVKTNRTLLFDKYVCWPFDEKNGKIKYKDNRDKTIPIKEDNLKRISDISTPLSQKDYLFLKDRKNSHHDTDRFNLKSITRVIVNHGGESVLDSNIALHPYYGFPIIPASAIKGATRHYCEEFNKLTPEESIKIFGSETKEGDVVIIDAWPASYTDLNSLELDVMTPHYKDYYSDSGSKLPSDDMNPEPHLFLSIRKSTCFEFAIKPSSSFNGDIKSLLNTIKILIIDALSTIGIGAKTGSNYGYFK